MTVRLISYSETLKKQISGERTSLLDQICYCARVSNPANQMLEDANNERLIRYLINHKHWSPFEMVNVCLEIETTRDIARQILRHRSFSFQEFSQRYADVNSLSLEFQPKEARLQDVKNRQNSLEFDDDDIKIWWEKKQEFLYKESVDIYNAALEHGLAKEVARSVLPEGLTKSKLYMNGTLRSWMHYIQLRSGNGTQKEHREIALECANAIEPIFHLITEFVEEQENI